MEIFKQEEIGEAAEKYSENKSSAFTFRETHKRDFKAGVEFAESKIEEIAIEFLDWVEKDYMRVSPCGDRYVKITNNQEDWPYNFRRITKKELFEQFIKERNDLL